MGSSREKHKACIINPVLSCEQLLTTGAKMNFKHLGDLALDQEIVNSVKTETNATLRILHLLREADRRRLYSKLKYQSLLDYAIRRLGYPYDQARRRIDAMKLLKEVPEIEEKISNGSLNLTNIGYAQIAFKAEAKKATPLNRVEKLEFLSRIENKSTRATQKIVAEEFGKEVFIRETIKPVTATISMMNLPATDELIAEIGELKGFLAHSNPGITTAELFSLLAKEKLAAIKKKKANNSAAPLKRVDKAPDAGASGANAGEENRYVPAHINRKLWARDQMKCTNCESTYAVQRDHRIPFRKGGKTTAKNLRLLCRSCNQRAAIEEYGLKKMGKYLRERHLVYIN